MRDKTERERVRGRDRLIEREREKVRGRERERARERERERGRDIPHCIFSS